MIFLVQTVHELIRTLLGPNATVRCITSPHHDQTQLVYRSYHILTMQGLNTIFKYFV